MSDAYGRGPAMFRGREARPLLGALMVMLAGLAVAVSTTLPWIAEREAAGRRTNLSGIEYHDSIHNGTENHGWVLVGDCSECYVLSGHELTATGAALAAVAAIWIAGSWFSRDRQRAVACVFTALIAAGLALVMLVNGQSIHAVGSYGSTRFRYGFWLAFVSAVVVAPVGWILAVTHGLPRRTPRPERDRSTRPPLLFPR